MSRMELVTISERDSMTASIQGSMMSSHNFGVRDSKDSIGKLQSIGVKMVEVGQPKTKSWVENIEKK